MPKPVVSTSSTAWQGDLLAGSGSTSLDTSALGTFAVSWKARTAPSGGTTTPEELIAAAHSACFSMAFSNELANAGTPPTTVSTRADVSFVVGQGITGIHLTVTALVDGISAEEFQRIAAAAKDGCPVSQALKATPITLTATLLE
jgi:osmotically inducible protein OsmC